MGTHITILEAFLVSISTIILLLIYLTISDDIKNKRK